MGDAGLEVDEIIEKFNGVDIESIENFTTVIERVKPGEEVVIKTDKKEYKVIAAEHPKIEDRGYLGVAVAPASVELKERTKERFGRILPWVFFWFNGLFSWIFMLSLGIGLINLLPLGPVDGGKMFHLAMLKITKNKEKSKNIWKNVSLISLALIVLNLVYPYFRDLVFWMMGVG